jgi:hypothetical protein
MLGFLPTSGTKSGINNGTKSWLRTTFPDAVTIQGVTSGTSSLPSQKRFGATRRTSKYVDQQAQLISG